MEPLSPLCSSPARRMDHRLPPLRGPLGRGTDEMRPRWLGSMGSAPTPQERKVTPPPLFVSGIAFTPLLLPPPPPPSPSPNPSATSPYLERMGRYPPADGSSSEEEQSESEEEKAIMMGYRSTKVTIVPQERGAPQVVHTADLEDLIVANTDRQHKEVMVAIKNLFGLDNKPILKTFAGYQATILHKSKRFDAPLSLKVLFLPSDLTPSS
jgi:hypothetical protein